MGTKPIWDEPLVEFPQRLNVELTNHCNQACVMCPHPEMERPKGMMTTETFQKIVDEAAPYQSKVWLHYLGEPLLNPKTLEMVEYAKNTTLSSVGFSTNGELLNKKIAGQLIDSQLDRLEISLDALEEEDFQRVRRSKSKTLDHVVSAVEMFLQLKREKNSQKPVVSLQFVRLEDKSDGFFDRVRNRWEPKLNAEDFIMCIDPINWADQKVVIPFDALNRGNPGSDRHPCPWLWRNPVIHWNGDVVLCGCDFDGKTVIGNVARQSLKDIWHSKSYTSVREAHQSGSFDVNPLCGSCQEWRLADFNDRYSNVR